MQGDIKKMISAPDINILQRIKLKYKLLLVISVYFNLFHLLSSWSQTDSLIVYLESAASNNPVVLQRFSEYQAALQKIPQVGSLPDPEFSAGVFIRPMELVTGTQMAEFRLMQMFPWFGTLKAAKDEMSLMAKARFEAFREARYQVFYDVRRTWYELYKIDQSLRITEKNLEILKSIERLTLVRYKTSSDLRGSTSSLSSGTPGQVQSVASSVNQGGMQVMPGSGSAPANTATGYSSSSMRQTGMNPASGTSDLADLYRIKIEIGDLENSISLLRDQFKTASAKFNSYLNRPLQSPVVIPDTLVTDTLNVSINLLPDSIIKNSPMLRMIGYEQQSLGARKEMVSRMGYPMVGIGVNYSLIGKSEDATSLMNGNDMIMPMVSATLPVYRKKYKAMQAEAEILRSSATFNYTAAANTVQTEYYQAVQDYNESFRRINLFSEQYLLAKRTFDIKLRNLSAAESNLTDILIIRQQMLDYELRQAEAVADFNIAIAWLNKLGSIKIN